MEESTKSEKEENPLKKEEGALNGEDLSENSQPDPQFEEQEGELLPFEEKKKSGSGKLFLLLVLILAGSGGYLYFNNQTPVEILDLVSQKPSRSKPPTLVVKSPSPPEFTLEEKFSPRVPEPVPVITEAAETHISGRFDESKSRISGSDLNQALDDKPKKDSREIARVEKLGQVAEKAMIEEQEVILNPTTGNTPSSLEKETSSIAEEPGSIAEKSMPESDPSPEKPRKSAGKRSKAVQAYLDFIETSARKFGELIRDGFYWFKDSLGKVA